MSAANPLPGIAAELAHMGQAKIYVSMDVGWSRMVHPLM